MKRAHAQHDRSSERVKSARRGLSGALTASYATIFHRDEAGLRASHFQCNIASIVTKDLRIISTPFSSARSPSTIVGA
jgi:hypothetical protein